MAVLHLFLVITPCAYVSRILAPQNGWFMSESQNFCAYIWQCVKTNSTPVVHMKIAGLKWMFIPLKMYFHRYWSIAISRMMPSICGFTPFYSPRHPQPFGSTISKGLGFCPRAAKMLKALRNLNQLHQEEKTHMKAGLQVILKVGVSGAFWVGLFEYSLRHVTYVAIFQFFFVSPSLTQTLTSWNFDSPRSWRVYR